MQEANSQNQDFNTALPYIGQIDPVISSDSTYVQYLYDSINSDKSTSGFIFQLKDIIIPQKTDSLKESVELQPSILFPLKTKAVEIKPQLRYHNNYDWLTGLLILCLIILTWIKYESSKRVMSIFKAVFARHNMNQLLRDGNILHERITPGLMFISLISSSTLVLLIMEHYGFAMPFTDNSFLVFSVIASVLLILWLIKLSIIRIIGKIFRTRLETGEYLITNIIFNIASGLLAFPFVLIGHYAENQTSIVIAGLIFILGMLVRFIRSIFVGLSAQSFPVVYIFLYLCTLEILPILVLYKFLNN